MGTEDHDNALMMRARLEPRSTLAGLSPQPHGEPRLPPSVLPGGSVQHGGHALPSPGGRRAAG